MMLGVPVAVRARDVPEATPMLGVIKSWGSGEDNIGTGGASGAGGGS